MKKEDLRQLLLTMCQTYAADRDKRRREAMAALLKYINDPEITRLFGEVAGA